MARLVRPDLIMENIQYREKYYLFSNLIYFYYIFNTIHWTTHFLYSFTAPVYDVPPRQRKGLGNISFSSQIWQLGEKR